MLPFQGGTCKSKNKIMSEKGSNSNKKEQAPDLSALDFGPSWARADKGRKSHGSDRSSDRSSTKGNSRSGSASESTKSPQSRKGGQRSDSRDNSRGREAKGHGRDGGRHSDKGHAGILIYVFFNVPWFSTRRLRMCHEASILCLPVGSHQIGVEVC